LLALSCLEQKESKQEKISWSKIAIALIVGLYFSFSTLLKLSADLAISLYILTTSAGYIFVNDGWSLDQSITAYQSERCFNMSESFMQETKLMQNVFR
jgi:hypothetical protein